MSNIKTVCFTGPRAKKLFGYNKAPWKPLQEHIAGLVNLLADAGADTFITGGAQGVDQIAFFAIHAVKEVHPEIKNIVHIVENQSSVWPLQGPFSQADFNLMCQLADNVELLTYRNTHAKSPAQLLHYRNESMLDASDVLVAVRPDGGDPHSGTRNAMDSARRRGIPIITIHPFTKQVLMPAGIID